VTAVEEECEVEVETREVEDKPRITDRMVKDEEVPQAEVEQLLSLGVTLVEIHGAIGVEGQLPQ